MLIKKILVTGANGQLGWELAQLADQFPQFEFIFLDRSQLDLSKPDSFESIIEQYAPTCIINTAAYTAVDKAETEQDLAYLINASAVAMLAKLAAQNNIHFITYSTDYVFSGQANQPYQPDTAIAPVNYYGSTKADGESLALSINPNTIIIRTSWVFSSHGNNFVKTMLRLMKERSNLNIVGDQKGRPTYAKDLALATITMLIELNEGKSISGIYHYANAGETTWFEFANTIKLLAGIDCELNAISTEEFPTPAKRPLYSVLATDKIEKALNMTIPSWQNALERCYLEIKNTHTD